MSLPRPAGAESGGEAPLFVFYIPPDDGEGFERAIRAHLSDLDAELRFESGPVMPQLRGRLEQAAELALLHGAQGVFWIDTAPDARDVLLILADPGATRMLVRRFGGASSVARVEEVALISRSLVSAVIDDGEIGVAPPPEAVEPEPVEPEASPPVPDSEETALPEEERGPPQERPERLELEIGYQGAALDQSAPWESGLRVAGGWLVNSRLTIGLGYVLWGVTDVDAGDFHLDLSRHTVEAGARYGATWGRLSLRGEVTILWEWAERIASGPAGLLIGTAADWALGFGTRLRVGVRMWRGLGLALSVGADWLVRRVRYVAKTPELQVLMDPWFVRPQVVISFYVQL